MGLTFDKDVSQLSRRGKVKVTFKVKLNIDVSHLSLNIDVSHLSLFYFRLQGELPSRRLAVTSLFVAFYLDQVSLLSHWTKMRFSVKNNIFSKCELTRRKLRICLHLLKKSSTENLIF